MLDLRALRLERGWKTSDVAELYGKYTSGKTISAGMIYKIEEGQLPMDAKRRAVLARMFGLSIATTGVQLIQPSRRLVQTTQINRKAIDVEEYRLYLQDLWRNGAQDAEATLIDLGTRINTIHSQVLYSRTQQSQLRELLVEFHIRTASIAKESGYTSGSLSHYTKAIVLAKESGFKDATATAYYRRAKWYIDAWNMQKGWHDLLAAEAQNPSPTIMGRVYSIKGLALSRTGKLAEAMREVDKSDRCINAPVGLGSIIDFPSSIWSLNRSLTLLSAPKGARPDLAEDTIRSTSIYREGEKYTRFHGFALIEDLMLQGMIYRSKGYYPLACSMFIEAVSLMKPGHIYMTTIEQEYEKLKVSSFGKSKDVAELGLKLLVLQMPHMFN